MMGVLTFFDIEGAIRSHGLQRFVETGTGTGESLAFAAKFPFISLWSCEIEPVLVDRAKDQFRDDRMTLFLWPSHKMLECLPQLPDHQRILFWLDAHFPGADYGLRCYGDEPDETIRLPLKQELALIKQHRPFGEDIIVIDDARLWLDDDFECVMPSELVADCCPIERGIGFIHDLFDETHRIEVIHRHTGYIVLSPRVVAETLRFTG